MTKQSDGCLCSDINSEITGYEISSVGTAGLREAFNICFKCGFVSRTAMATFIG